MGSKSHLNFEPTFLISTFNSYNITKVGSEKLMFASVGENHGNVICGSFIRKKDMYVINQLYYTSESKEN